MTTCCRALALLSVTLLLQGCATLRYTPQEPVVPKTAYALTDSTEVRVDLSQVPSLQQVGGAATIIDDRLPRHLLIAQTSEGMYVAAAAHCTHGGRALAYEHEDQQLRCSSLGHSKFRLDGSVIGGPAKGPVPLYRVSVVDGQLAIDLTACGVVGCPHAGGEASGSVTTAP